MNVLVICGSLRKGSYNAALARALPALAPEGMHLTDAPRVDTMPHYNYDDQVATGFPASAVAFADAIRAADGVIIVSPEYNWTIPGTLKNALEHSILRRENQQLREIVGRQRHVPRRRRHLDVVRQRHVDTHRLPGLGPGGDQDCNTVTIICVCHHSL